MAQALKLLVQTREGSSKKETCKGMSSFLGPKHFSVTEGGARTASCHAVPYGHRGIHVPPPAIHPLGLFLAEVPDYICSFPEATHASSCLH